MAISDKQKYRQTENLTTSVAFQVVKNAKMTTQCANKDGKAAKVTISSVQWLIMHFNLTWFIKTYEYYNINKDDHFISSEMTLNKRALY